MQFKRTVYLNMYNLLVLSLLCSTILSVCNSTELCHKVSSCSCRNSEGLIDLSPLAKTDNTPAFSDLLDSPGYYKYSWNPCHPFTEGTCIGVAGCQQDTDSGDFTSIGKQDSALFINDVTDGLQIQYTDGAKTLFVTLNCNKTETGKLDVKGENPPRSKQYYLTLHSKYACPATEGGGENGPVSIGTIVVIAISGCVIIYIVGGVIFQKFVRKASGAELLPNYNFWYSVFGTIHTGFLFVFRCGRGNRVYSEI
ncbi:cation-dependent mannose-6-phosphate receptor-like [Haliotis asinina]|uniref:cation-dependent mannose-6-phosphate receptor-like n=1 Tax=Haliotis asinina TaxID=109174 RepID=UPI003531BD75